MRSALSASPPPLRVGGGLLRHFVAVNPSTPNSWWAFAFSLVFSAAALAGANGGGSQSILLYFVAAGAVAAMFPAVTVQSVGRNLILLAFPAWLILSISWSTDRSSTVHQALLIAPTLVASLTLGGMTKRREVNLGAAMALFVLMILSITRGGMTQFSDTGEGGVALTGLGTGKNFFGHLAAMSVIMSFSFFAFGGARARTRLLVLIGAADLALSTFELYGSHATGSILSALLAIAVIGVMLLFKRVPWGVRVIALAALGAAVTAYVTFGTQIQQALGDALLAKFNKDSTLTGRTMLWDYADRLMQDHRMLGYGNGAFWTLANPDAWALWRMAGVAPMSGFNFHNTPREILIACGFAGLVIYIASFGPAFVAVLLRGLRSGDPASAVRVAFIIYFIVRMPVESTGFGPVTIDGTMLLAFLCAPARPPSPAGIPTHSRSAPDPRSALA